MFSVQEVFFWFVCLKLECETCRHLTAYVRYTLVRKELFIAAILSSYHQFGRRGIYQNILVGVNNFCMLLTLFAHKYDSIEDASCGNKGFWSNTLTLSIVLYITRGHALSLKFTCTSYANLQLNFSSFIFFSRIFIKILFQELAQYLGIQKFNIRLKDP